MPPSWKELRRAPDSGSPSSHGAEATGTIFQFTLLSLLYANLPGLGATTAILLWGLPQTFVLIHAYAICLYVCEMLSNLNENLGQLKNYNAEVVITGLVCLQCFTCVAQYGILLFLRLLQLQWLFNCKKDHFLLLVLLPEVSVVSIDFVSCRYSVNGCLHHSRCFVSFTGLLPCRFLGDCGSCLV